MFAKVYSQIFDSSIAEDYRVRLVFEDFLKLADKQGIVDMTRESIARRTNVPIEIVTLGITALEKVDTTSRTPEMEGRRIVRLDEHRDWGWKIVNFQKYRESATKEMLRMNETDRKRAYRSGHRSTTEGYVYFLVKKSPKSNIKIGFSANPWSRCEELQTGSDEPFMLIGTIKANLQDEAKWHERYSEDRVRREWFRFSERLVAEIKAHCDNYDSSYYELGQGERSSTTSASASASASASIPRDGGMGKGDRPFPEIEVPSWQEIQVECAKIGLVEWRARDWFNEMERSGWIDGQKREVKKWRAFLATIKVYWERDGRPMTPPKGKTASLKAEKHPNIL